MKSSIIPIAIIIGLIVFFFFVDRKEFNRHDSILNVQIEKRLLCNSQLIDYQHIGETGGVTPEITSTESKPVATEAKATEHQSGESPSTAKSLEAVTELKPAEGKPAETNATAQVETQSAKSVVEAPPKETTPLAEIVSENKSVPTAIPVLTQEEARVLVERMDKEREDAKKRGLVFYEELFLSTKGIPSFTNIEQTTNWVFVPKDGFSYDISSARKQGFFNIQSEIPLEFSFIEPLFEHTMYRYTLCCSVKGKGTIYLSQKNGKNSKEVAIHSKSFEMIVHELGNGTTLNTPIVPMIGFQGNLQVDSIIVYQKPTNKQQSICLGTIESISSIPDIKKANYPDCYYTAKFSVKDILDGAPAPQNIQLLIPAFLDNKIDPLSKIMKKGNWKVSIRPYSLATKEEQEIEQVDEIESYLYTPYILVAAAPDSIPELAVSGIPILEGDSYVSPFDHPVNPPLPDKFVQDSNIEIKKELAKVNEIITKAEDDDYINERFQNAWSEKQKVYNSLNSTIIWAKEHNSFFALPKDWTFIPSAQISENNLNAIVELDHFFKSQGIQLIIQIVPDYYDIAALVLNPEFQKYGDQRSARATKQLLDRGVETHYISDELVKNAFNYERLFFYPFDFHPDEGAMEIMTTLIAQRLEQYGNLLPKDLDVELFTEERRETGAGKNLKWPKNVDIGSHEADSAVYVPYVLYNKNILDSNPESSVLVFGNSFTQEPMTKNAFISYLAKKILHVCSCRAMGGVSALTALPQQFLLEPEKFLKNKTIAILPISISYLADNKYILPNVAKTDETLKKTSKADFVASLPIKQDGFPLYPSSFNFSYNFLANYLPSRTSCIALSELHSKATFSIPDSIDAKKFRISIQPLYGYGVSVFINGKAYKLPSRHTPKWEIYEFDIDNNKTITIELDIPNCSSNEAKILVGSVSLFK